MRKLLLLVGAFVFVDSLFYAALTPLLPAYADELDLTKAEAGVLAASYATGAFFGAVPGGISAARLGVRPTVLFGLGGMTATTLAFGLLDQYELLVAARFLQGVASSFTWTAGLAWLVAAAPASRRGELIGSAMAAAIGGALFGPVLGGIASVVGTDWAFGSVAVLGAALAVWTWLTPAIAPAPPQPLSLLARSLLDRGILGAGWFVLLPALLFGVLGVLGPLRLDELGFGAVAIGATWLTAAALEAVVTPMLGRLSDRRGRLLPLRAGLLASAAIAAMIPWLGNAWVLALAVVVAAMAFGSFWAPGMSLLADRAEARGLDYAFAFALVSMAWAPGAAGGAAVGAAVAQVTGDWVPYLALAGACLVTFATLRGAQRPTTNSLEPSSLP
ncbi:MAG: MFS transporter [Pseudomonadota bacterium]